MKRKVVDVEEFKCNIFFEYSDPFYFYHIYTLYIVNNDIKKKLPGLL